MRPRASACWSWGLIRDSAGVLLGRIPQDKDLPWEIREALEAAILRKSADDRGFPFSRRDLSSDLCDGYAERGVAVQYGDADLTFGDLAVEVPCHQALSQKFQAMHPIVGKTIPRIVF